MAAWKAGEPRATFDAMAAFMRNRLVQSAAFASGEPFRALSETAERFNESRWFWTDDNAKAAELLCEPVTYDADPALADAVLDFVLRLSRGDIVQRRAGGAELRLVADEAAAFRVETAFFALSGDLTRGAIRHALRFNDGRPDEVGIHGGHEISFRHAGRRVVQALGATVAATAVERVGDDAVALWSVSTLRGQARGSDPGLELGRLATTLRLAANCPTVELAFELRAAPGIPLEEVQLTTGITALARTRRTAFRLLATLGDAGARFAAATPGRGPNLPGPAGYSACTQAGGAPGFAQAVHVLHRDGERLVEVAAWSRRGGIEALRHTYRLGDVPPGGTAAIREARMATGGGFPDVPGHYAAVMRNGTGGGEIDPTMSYDTGAELNAVATHLLFAKRGAYARPPSPERLATLTAWYDRHLARLLAFTRPDAADAPSRLFSRGLAFTVLSLDCMWRATGEPGYRALLERGTGLILGLQDGAPLRPARRGRLFGDRWAPIGRFLDNHAACILALARAARHGDPDGRLGRAIQAALSGIELFAGTVRLGPGHVEAYRGLAVRNRRGWHSHVDTTFWSYKLGLLLRALHAVADAAVAGAIAMGTREQAALRRLIEAAEALLAPCLRCHPDGGVEALTSPIASETNSETQPWVALGLVPLVDRRIVALAPPPRPGA